MVVYLYVYNVILFLRRLTRAMNVCVLFLAYVHVPCVYVRVCVCLCDNKKYQPYSLAGVTAYELCTTAPTQYRQQHRLVAGFSMHIRTRYSP